MAKYWSSSFFAFLLTETKSRQKKNAKENIRLELTSLSIKDLLYGQQENFYLRDQGGKSRAEAAI